MTQSANAPETKSADPTAAFEEFARAFEAFKEGNDARLAEIDRRLCADVVTEEKVARIGATLDATKARLDRLALDGRRPALGDSPGGRPRPRRGRAQGRLPVLRAHRRGRGPEGA